jgi:cytochrome c peroxidase
LLGPYNDDTTGASAAHTRQVAMERGNYGEFKVPPLRNLMLTAPYGHDGDAETIAEVVRRHANDGQYAGVPHLTPREQTDLVVFLESLSTFSNPWRPDDAGRCE